MLLEPLQHSGPAPLDIIAHGLAGFCSHLLEFPMLELDAGCVRAFGDEPHFDLGVHRAIWLPLAVDVPGHDKPSGRLPDDDLAYRPASHLPKVHTSGRRSG